MKTKRRRIQRLLLGLLFGTIAGLLDRRVRKKIAPAEKRGNIEAED